MSGDRYHRRRLAIAEMNSRMKDRKFMRESPREELGLLEKISARICLNYGLDEKDDFAVWKAVHKRALWYGFDGLAAEIEAIYLKKEF